MIKEDEIRVKNGKVEICTEITYTKSGCERQWEDYDDMFLRSTLGQCGHSEEMYPLSYFHGIFLKTKRKEEKDLKKIRYAYITSPTNMKIDPGYLEILQFKVVTIEQLKRQSQKFSLSELLTNDKAALITILGRDRYMGRKDMDGNEIYEGDIIRWFIDSYKQDYIDETAVFTSPFWEQESERECKIIGTIYDWKKEER